MTHMYLHSIIYLFSISYLPQESKSSAEIKQLMNELELERDHKHDLEKRLEDISKKLWCRKLDSDVSSQEMVTIWVDFENCLANCLSILTFFFSVRALF